MKNVAKCDTWCELQNPVNHRVFERKLRPRPPGRGHACLGVTRTSRSGACARAAGREVWPPPRGGPKIPRSSRPLRAGERRPTRHQRMTSHLRRPSHRDSRSGGATR
ncbi:hypothetical protein IHE45_20G009000 [Dioscorea alata]|uniref:Uncharacterized protein n=1 Tax=Dioscorea alata TaxID=55571 RepID=A0ACB7TSK1_DIOAL|nr:hypothetical protein IHE45_20G009000 [Dioscorea alata]